MYIVYKIINKLNNCIYVGVHKTDNINDGYMGSGKLIIKSIKKNGIENFEKRILYVTEFKHLAYKCESLIVTTEFAKRRDTYNMKAGGYGGAIIFTDKIRENFRQARLGKPSNAKGKCKKPNDGKWEGTAHKGKDNPRAKKINIYNEKDEIMFECHGNFHKILIDYELPKGYFRKTLKLGKSFDCNIKNAMLKNRETLKKYQGWYAKEIND